jgi:hypothetical protein
MAVHGLVPILVCAIRFNRGQVSDRSAKSAALGALILVWAAYFFQQPHPWNIWSFMLPFGLLSGSYLALALARPSPTMAARLFSVPVSVFVLVTGPTIIQANRQALESIVRRYSVTEPAQPPNFSGVRLSEDKARDITERAAFLRSFSREVEAFSGNSYLLPKLSGRVDAFRALDPAFMAATKTQFDALLQNLRDKGPEFLLFEDPNTPGASQIHKKYYSFLLDRLHGSYQFEEMRSGWAIWHRRPKAGPG